MGIITSAQGHTIQWGQKKDIPQTIFILIKQKRCCCNQVLKTIFQYLIREKINNYARRKKNIEMNHKIKVVL